jgi:hypothetical protein
MDLFKSSTAVLRHPVWYSDAVTDDIALPLSASDYQVTHGNRRDGRWTVTSSNGEVVYRGIGPVFVTEG